MTKTPWMTREETAVHLNMNAKTLANMAAETPPRGPPFWNPNGGVRGGRVRYHRALVDRWNGGDHRFLGLQKVPTALEDAGLVPRVVISQHGDKIASITEDQVRIAANLMAIDDNDDMTWWDARLPEIEAMLMLPPLKAVE